MKWKTVAGVALMVLSLTGMVLWETVGREKFFPPVVEAPVEIVETAEPRSVFADGSSYFNIPQEWIYSRSTLLTEGSKVAVYLMDAEAEESPCMGHYSIAAVGEAYVELLCRLDDYLEMRSMLTAEASRGLLFVMED